MELPSHCCRHSLSPPAPSSVAHHTFCKASCLTARVLQGFRLHTTHPANFAPLVLEACQLHSTHPASLQASHHTSCKPILLYTTRPASFTPLRIQGCVTDRGIQKSLPFFVFATQFPKLSASFILLSSNHRVTTDGVHEARAGAPICTDAFHPCR